MQSLYRGGLYNEVAFERWPLSKSFTLIYMYYMTCSIFLFPVSISTVSNALPSSHKHALLTTSSMMFEVFDLTFLKSIVHVHVHV